MFRKIMLIAVGIIVFSNLPFFDFFTLENYCYTNSDHSFTFCEEGDDSMSFEVCLRRYGYFLGQHPEKDLGDNNLYRTFTIKPWRFWEWRQMIFHNERFQLPYKAP